MPAPTELLNKKFAEINPGKRSATLSSGGCGQDAWNKTPGYKSLGKSVRIKTRSAHFLEALRFKQGGSAMGLISVLVSFLVLPLIAQTAPADEPDVQKPQQQPIVTRVSSSPLRLSLEAVQTPAKDVFEALAKEAGIDLLVSDELTVPITAHIQNQSPQYILNALSQFKAITVTALRVPPSFEIKKADLAKIALTLQSLRELGISWVGLEPAQGSEKVRTALILTSTSSEPARVQVPLEELKTVWLVVPTPQEPAKPSSSENVNELARLNQRMNELIMKLSPEERKAYQQTQLEQFRQMPLPMQQQFIMDGMNILLSLTPKEQGDLLIGIFRRMTPEQQKAFIGLGSAFVQHLQPGELN
jgi:hypothetical protein